MPLVGTQKYDIAVILVGMNAREYVRGCLDSLASARWGDLTHEVVYVDNASTDGSVEMVEAAFPAVRILSNSTNIGFCKAANQGARAADSRYYMFVNDDTVAIEDAIAKLARFMDAVPDAGAVGSRLLYADGSEQWSARRFPTVLSALFGRRSVLHRLFPDAPPVRRYLYKAELAGSAPFEVEWVSAAGVMFRREMFRAVAGFAEDYYYWHEILISDRLRARGWKTYLHPESRVIHFEGKGSGPRPYRVQRFHILDFHRGAYRCYCEHYGLGLISPRRWLVGAALGARALGLLVTSWVSSHFSGWSRASQRAAG